MDPVIPPAIVPANGAAAPVVPPVVAAPTPSGPVPVGISSEQLRDRLAEEREKARKSLLTELGFEKIDDAKAVVTSAKAKADAEKTETERLTGRVKQLEPLETEVATLREAVAAQAKDAMSALTDAQRAAVAAVAGDSAAAQIKTIAALRPTWATPAAVTAPAAAVVVAPATTTSPNAAPAPASTSSPTDHKAAYESLKTKNPIAAAQYLARHKLEIYPPKQ